MTYRYLAASSLFVAIRTKEPSFHMKVSLLATILFGCCTLIETQNSTEVARENAIFSLYVLTVLPYVIPELIFNPSHAPGHALYIAIELAAEMINNRTDILDGYQLKLLQENGGCDVPFRSIEGLVRGLSLGRDDPPIVGMIGPACSISSTSAAAFNGRKDVSLLNIYSGGTPEINNRTKYPFSFGILDSVDVIAETLVALIRDNSWKNISEFHEESRLYFSSLSHAFNRKLSEYNEELREDGEVEVDIDMRNVVVNNPLHVRSVQNMNRIVIFMVNEDLLKKMVCVLYHMRIKFPNYLFILAGLEAFNPSKVLIPPENKICTADIIEGILATSVLIDYQLETSDEKEIKFSDLSLESFKELYKERIQKVNAANKTDIQLSREGAMFFDGLWSLALALNNSIDQVNLTTYKFLGQQESTKIIRNKLMTVDYEGLSGRIRFNNKTGRVEQNVSISLIKMNREMKIAYYSKNLNRIIQIHQDSYKYIFISDQFMLNIKTIPQSIVYLILISAAIAFFVTGVVNTLTIVYRERKPVKASGIKLNWMTFISCYVFVLAMLLNILIHGYSDIMTPTGICILQHIFDTTLSVGLTLLFGTACMRTWRLYRIFVHFMNPGNFLSNNVLMGVMCAVVFVDLILVILPVSISRYKPDFKDITSKENTEAVLTRIVVCNRTNYLVWLFCSLVVSITLMIILLVLTIQTRNITHKHFTTKWTVCQLYSLTIILPFFWGLYLTFYFKLTYASIIAQFVIHSFLMLSLLFISNLILILPLLQVFQESKFYLRRWPTKRKSSLTRMSSILRRPSIMRKSSIIRTPNMRNPTFMLEISNFKT